MKTRIVTEETQICKQKRNLILSKKATNIGETSLSELTSETISIKY